MEIILIILAISAVILAIVKLTYSVRAHYELQDYDLEELRSKLLNRIIELQQLEEEVQAAFHPMILEKMKEDHMPSSGINEFRDRADDYYNQVKATDEMRDMLLSKECEIPLKALKLIEAHIEAGTDYCSYYLNNIPESLRLSKLKGSE